MAVFKPQQVDGMRPIRRRTPQLNPHHRTFLKIKKRPWKLTPSFVSRFLIILFVFLGISVYIVLFWTSLFQIDEPIILGTQRVSKDKISESVASLLNGVKWGLAPRKALFAVSSQEIKENILDSSQAIKDVEIRKELPNILKINVIEREPLAIWSAAGEFFFIDERGIAYDEIARSESRDVSLPVIVDEGHSPTLEGDRVITQDTLNFVREAFQNIKNIAGIGINFFIAPSRLAPDLILVTSEGWRVMFDVSVPAKTQALTLKEILEKQVTDRASLQYIDMRISGRVFVK